MRTGLAAALAQPADRRRHAVSDVVRADPDVAVGLGGTRARWPGTTWRPTPASGSATTGASTRLRGAGWKGSGLVRWAHESNRGFLRCLDGLRSSAGAIGEHDEEERCGQFLRQLDPAWRPDWTGIPA